MATYGTFIDGVKLTAAEANDFLVWKTFTVAVRQSTNPLQMSSSFGRYAQINKMVFFTAFAIFGDTGLSNTAIEFTLPVTAASSTQTVVASAYIKDNSPADIIRLVAVASSTTRLKFFSDESTSMSIFFGETNGPAFQIGSSDAISITGMYEAA